MVLLAFDLTSWRCKFTKRKKKVKKRGNRDHNHGRKYVDIRPRNIATLGIYLEEKKSKTRYAKK